MPLRPLLPAPAAALAALLLATAPAVPTGAHAQTAGASPPSAASARPGVPRTLNWDELLPPGWDPLKDFRGLDFAGLQDSDPRAQQMLKRLREAWDSAPTNPKLDGQAVRLPGFVVPLEESPEGLREFLLVPYFGACIHTPPPPANQIVHVLPRGGAKFRAMDTVWVAGTLKLVRTDSLMGVASYRLDGAVVEAYTGIPR